MCRRAIVAWFFFLNIDFAGLVYNTTHIDMYFCPNHAMKMNINDFNVEHVFRCDINVKARKAREYKFLIT